MLPLVSVHRVLILVVNSCRHNFDTVHEKSVETGHELAGRELNPSLFGISNDNYFAALETVLKQQNCLGFDLCQILAVLFNEEVILRLVNRIQVRCREQCIVPVQNYKILTLLGLLHGRQPYLLLCELGKVSKSELLVVQ